MIIAKVKKGVGQDIVLNPLFFLNPRFIFSFILSHYINLQYGNMYYHIGGSKMAYNKQKYKITILTYDQSTP